MSSKNTLHISCHKATELVEKKRAIKLSWVERIKLFIHTKMCKICHSYISQSELLEKGMYSSAEHTNLEKLDTADLQQRIVQKLNSKI